MMMRQKRDAGAQFIPHPQEWKALASGFAHGSKRMPSLTGARKNLFRRSRSNQIRCIHVRQGRAATLRRRFHFLL
ncbi:MAG TPA: hypothetical protein VFF81_06885, partial [Noviherbaspirillum sp.]|nr:hypothetical protein [Noviherbaspirillum sp.]